MSSSSYSTAAAPESVELSRTDRTPQPSAWLAVWTLWSREVRAFYRQRSRVLAGLATPLIFWGVLGSGFGSSLRTGGHYADFFYPGAVTLVVLFASVFANISIIEDRREGFLLSVLASPTPRGAMTLGKVAGATSIGLIQGAFFLPLAFALETPVHAAALPAAVVLLALTAFGLTSLGFAFAWRLNSVQGFHSVMNVVLMPMWLLSGAFFPAAGAASWMQAAMLANPLTYAVAGLRQTLFGPTVEGPSLAVCWSVTAAFAVVAFAAAAREASRPSPENLL